jgi:hypothetical protein
VGGSNGVPEDHRFRRDVRRYTKNQNFNAASVTFPEDMDERRLTGGVRSNIALSDDDSWMIGHLLAQA